MLWLSLYNLKIDEELWLKLWMLIFPLHGFFNLVIFLFHKVYNYRRLHSDESVGEVISLLFRTKDVQEPCFVERISIVRDYHSSLEGPSNTTALRLSDELVGDRILIRRSPLVGKRSASGENSPPHRKNELSIIALFRWTSSSQQPDDSNRELASESVRVSRTSGLFDLSVDSSNQSKPLTNTKSWALLVTAFNWVVSLQFSTEFHWDVNNLGFRRNGTRKGFETFHCLKEIVQWCVWLQGKPLKV